MNDFVRNAYGPPMSIVYDIENALVIQNYSSSALADYSRGRTHELRNLASCQPQSFTTSNVRVAICRVAVNHDACYLGGLIVV